MSATASNCLGTVGFVIGPPVHRSRTSEPGVQTYRGWSPSLPWSPTVDHWPPTPVSTRSAYGSAELVRCRGRSLNQPLVGQPLIRRGFDHRIQPRHRAVLYVAVV